MTSHKTTKTGNWTQYTGYGQLDTQIYQRNKQEVTDQPRIAKSIVKNQFTLVETYQKPAQKTYSFYNSIYQPVPEDKQRTFKIPKQQEIYKLQNEELKEIKQSLRNSQKINEVTDRVKKISCAELGETLSLVNNDLDKLKIVEQVDIIDANEKLGVLTKLFKSTNAKNRFYKIVDRKQNKEFE